MVSRFARATWRWTDDQASQEAAHQQALVAADAPREGDDSWNLVPLEAAAVKLETKLLLEKHMAELGLEFDREYRFHPERLWRADYRITNRLRNGQMMLIEIEGGVHRFKNAKGVMIVGHHHHQKGFQSDLDKYNQAVKLGYGVLRFSTHDVLRGRARAFLADMFGRGK